MPDEPTGQEPETETGPTVEELQEQLDTERTKNTQLVTRLDRLEGLLIQQGVNRGGGAEEEEEEEAPQPRRRAEAPREEEPSFEDMSTKEAVRYVLGEFDKRLTAQEKKLETRIARVQQEAEATKLVDEISSVLNEYGDDQVLPYQSNITQIMAGNPKLSVEDALVLAYRRAGKPMPEPKGKAKAEPSKSEAPASGSEGLQPRGSRGSVKSEKQPANFEEAGAAAWKKLGLSI